MCILMLFQTADRLTYKEIAETTEIPTADLKRALQSMSLMKGKNVLRKEPVGKDVNDDDIFHFNDKFKSQTLKVRSPPLPPPSAGDLASHVTMTSLVTRMKKLKASLI